MSAPLTPASEPGVDRHSEIESRLEALTRENQLLRREAAGADRFWDWDITAGTIRVTRAAEHAGTAESSILFSEWEASLHPDDRERVRRELDHYLARRLPRYHTRYRVADAGGAWKWVRDHGIAMWDEQGRPLRMSGAETDLEHGGFAPDDHLSREARLRSIFASLAEGLVIQDLTGVVVYCNAAAERMFGVELGSLVGRPSSDPIWRAYAEDGAALDPTLHPAACTLRTGEPRTGFVMGVNRPDGRRVWLSVNSQPLRRLGEGGIEGVVLSFVDITPMRRMTNRLLEAQKLESVARLAGGIAHDFNNLLTAVLGYADLALRDVDASSKLARYLGQIATSGEQAAGLTRQLLAFARRQPVRPVSIDPGELVEDASQLLRAWIGERVQVRTVVERPLWPVFADRGQLQQVLFNLASNARDAMPQGGQLEIRVRNRRMTGEGELLDGDYVEIEVEDDGSGMDEEVQSHLFEPFFTTKDYGEGSGLGLATCYGIVRQHGGSIRARSSPGAGSCFRILLPRPSA